MLILMKNTLFISIAICMLPLLPYPFLPSPSEMLTENRDDFINLIISNSSLEFVEYRVELIRRQQLIPLFIGID